MLVITAKLFKNRGVVSAKDISSLLKFLDLFGNAPYDWQIYRENEFQLRLAEANKALYVAFWLKSYIRIFGDLEIKIAIGIGEEDSRNAELSYNTGSAYRYSNTAFERLMQNRQTIVLCTGCKKFDENINLLLELAEVFMGKWSKISAETVFHFLMNPKMTQQELAAELGISQSTISQRLNRAHYEHILKIDRHFKTGYADLKADPTDAL